MAIQTQEQFVRGLNQVVSRLSQNLVGARVDDENARRIIHAVQAEIYSYLRSVCPGPDYFFLREGGHSSQLSAQDALSLIDVTYDNVTQSLQIDPSRMVRQVLWDRVEPLTTVRIDGRPVRGVGPLGQFSGRARRDDRADALAYSLSGVIGQFGSLNTDVPPPGRRANPDLTQHLLERQSRAAMEAAERQSRERMTEEASRLGMAASEALIQHINQQAQEEFNNFRIHVPPTPSREVVEDQDFLREVERAVEEGHSRNIDTNVRAPTAEEARQLIDTHLNRTLQTRFVGRSAAEITSEEVTSTIEEAQQLIRRAEGRSREEFRYMGRPIEDLSRAELEDAARRMIADTSQVILAPPVVGKKDPPKPEKQTKELDFEPCRVIEV